MEESLARKNGDTDMWCFWYLLNFYKLVSLQPGCYSASLTNVKLLLVLSSRRIDSLFSSKLFTMRDLELSCWEDNILWGPIWMLRFCWQKFTKYDKTPQTSPQTSGPFLDGEKRLGKFAQRFNLGVPHHSDNDLFFVEFQLHETIPADSSLAATYLSLNGCFEK